jgi:hypothetical protein
VNAQWARDLRDVSVAVGLGVSIVLWCAYSRFYDKLGIAPADVGIGFGQVVERSLGAIPLMLVFELVWLLLAALVYALASPAGTPPRERYARIQRLGAPTSSNLGPASSGRRHPHTMSRSWWRDKLAVDGAARSERQAKARMRQRRVSTWALLAFAPILLLCESAGVLLAGTAAICLVAWSTQDRFAVVLDVAAFKVVALGGVLVTAALIWLAAGTQAELVKHGHPVDLEFLGFSTYAFTASRAVLTTNGHPRCVLYLGAVDGEDVVYDDGVERVRIASGRLDRRPDPDRC